MATIIYPYRRIITNEYLQRIGFLSSLIDDTLGGMQFSFHYQAGLLPRNIVVLGEKNGTIEAFVERLGSWHKKEIIESDKITIVQNSPEYRGKFAPKGIELGELVELDDVDYSAFVDGLQKLRGNN